MKYTITARCANGHTQELVFDGLGLAYTEQQAKLIDGTSSMYVHSPIGTDSVIGKCGICGAQIQCSVSEYVEPTPAPPPPPVDRTQRILTNGEPVPADNSHTVDRGDGQQKHYVVLTAAERAKGFIRPVRNSYVHVGLEPRMHGIVLVRHGLHGCGRRTVMSHDIAETYARDPKFYTGTYCSTCGAHRPLAEFYWEGTTEVVGS